MAEDTKYYYCYEPRIFAIQRHHENTHYLHIVIINQSEVYSIFRNSGAGSNKLYRHALCEEVFKLRVEDSEVREGATFESTCRKCADVWRAANLLEA